MKLLLNWFLTAVILFGLSEFTSFLVIDDFTTALKLAIVISLIEFLLRIASGFMKFTGCLTLGISYLAGILLSIFSLPIALMESMPYVQGYSIPSYYEAIIVSVILTFLSMLILDRKKSSN
ncbi:MAG: phage holin family protein [Tissierellia bacterium]|jgi:uncharacterized membrane protein YvlD (DUF360 family)|nr:phage holin family protein [Tissierellia bacterium]